MSIQSLKQSLPELSDAAFEKVYRQFFIKVHATLLGYEVARCTGLPEGEGWDEILIVSTPNGSVAMVGVRAGLDAKTGALIRHSA
jgi:hypothetical protein